MKQFDVARATAARHHLRMQTVRQADDLVAVRLQRRDRLQRIAHVDQLNLADQDRIRRAGLEAAGQTRGARRG